MFAPNDPYKDLSLWPTYPGELTNEGKRQLYELGKWLRSRYDGFLSPIYDKREIYVRSSDDDRCLMSAEAKLAGLYKPQGKDVWNNGLSWQPIPVHTEPRESDDISEVERACPRFVSLMGKVENLPHFVNMKEKHKDLLDFLSNKTGMELSKLWYIWELYGTLNIERSMNFSLPVWATDALPQLKEICDISLELYTCTPLNLKLTIGRFYNELLSQFDSILNGKSDTYKFKAYSSHDTQVFSVLYGLDVPEIGMPPWAALVIFELRRSKEGNPYVQTFYKKEDNVDLIQIPDCGQKCEIDDFKKKLQPISITKEEYAKECN